MQATPREVGSRVFAAHRARCSECKRIFQPHVRLKERQKTCAQIKCRRQARARYQQSYREKNLEIELEYRQKRKRSLAPDFWKQYRLAHPASTQRNRVASKLRARLKRQGLQRKLDIVQAIDPTGFFERYCEFAMRHRSLIEEVAGTHAA